MKIDVGYIALAFVFSGTGFVYFSYGRKQSKYILMITGMILMIYPYFFDSKLWLTVVGLGLSALPHLPMISQGR